MDGLPPIPTKSYFTIGEVAELCDVKPHVLRYWEQEFTQLKPAKRRGNRRYYQHHEVLLIRRIRELLYDHGFTIQGARNQLQEKSRPVQAGLAEREGATADDFSQTRLQRAAAQINSSNLHNRVALYKAPTSLKHMSQRDALILKQELEEIRKVQPSIPE